MIIGFETVAKFLQRFLPNFQLICLFVIYALLINKPDGLNYYVIIISSGNIMLVRSLEAIAKLSIELHNILLKYSLGCCRQRHILARFGNLAMGAGAIETINRVLPQTGETIDKEIAKTTEAVASAGRQGLAKAFNNERLDPDSAKEASKKNNK